MNCVLPITSAKQLAAAINAEVVPQERVFLPLGSEKSLECRSFGETVTTRPAFLRFGDGSLLLVYELVSKTATAKEPTDVFVGYTLPPETWRVGPAPATGMSPREAFALGKYMADGSTPSKPENDEGVVSQGLTLPTSGGVPREGAGQQMTVHPDEFGGEDHPVAPRLSLNRR